jgi:hypothetical protein
MNDNINFNKYGNALINNSNNLKEYIIKNNFTSNNKNKNNQNKNIEIDNLTEK